MIDKTAVQVALEASQHLELAAFHLYQATQVQHTEPLPSWDSDDAKDMRVDARYRAAGAHKRSRSVARAAVVERVAVVLAVANGDMWPSCDNQIHRGLSVERRAVLAAMRRQRYRHQARIVCAEVSRFYEIDQDSPGALEAIVLKARQQQDADSKIVSAYRSRVGRGEVVAIGERE
ncbi:MAG: hypothetical protein EB141_06165 [Verrucomicrobia bacterium]|nr:hypothetical protein [Verrucomicrobiota bacterium]NBU11284.1 hypothetical protein [Pseudomonadota bacterium]NDA66525.1 hypothetical protein [Verrucomicrobiota bacterium]NDB75217.1 hypothetical protein [Verrucomicrobiota bacterium]NDD37439.1 hypothetical protein [Verrucomicrobiota bacterium]